MSIGEMILTGEETAVLAEETCTVYHIKIQFLPDREQHLSLL
jgi:hypothetical protein